MKKVLLLFVFLFISGLIVSQTQSYLPENPKIVKLGVTTIEKTSDREMLVKIVGICEPIKTRVIKNGNRTYYEPVNIQNSVDIATIKTRDDSKYASESLFKETRNLLVSAYSKPGNRQRMIISGEDNTNHPSKFWFIKTEQKWTSTFVSGVYKNDLYVWKSHFADFSVTKIDWLLLITFIIFFIVLLLLIVYAFLLEIPTFLPWLEKTHKGLYEWLEDGTRLFLIFMIFGIFSLIIILCCQWIVFLICAAMFAISVFLITHATDIYEWILKKKSSKKN